MKRSAWPLGARATQLSLGLLLALVGVAALVYRLSCPTLELGDRTSGELLASYRLSPGGEFSVSFIHSVNQSPVEDFYRVEEGEFLVYQTLYYHFGAGVQTQLEEGQVLTEQEDGGMLLENLDQIISPLLYNISPVYDHVLHIGAKEFSLKELDRRALIFTLKEPFFTF